MNNNKLHNESEENLRKIMKGSNESSGFFKVPEGYFEKLPSDISSKINSPYAPESVLFTLPRLLAGFAVIALLVAAFLYLNPLEKENEKSVEILTYDEILDSGYLSEFDDQLIYETSVETTINDEEFDRYKNFLIENNVDVSLIMNEL